MSRVIVTGGAGFVGSWLGILRKRDYPGDRVVALDNLSRPGSELNLPRLAAAGVEFVRGDARRPEDLEALGDADLVIDCAAEPSVRAGYSPAASAGSAGVRELVDLNLGGTLRLLDFAHSRGARLVFLSTSRVYPIDALRALPLEEHGERLRLRAGAAGPGWSESGISTAFPTTGGARSFYGTTKLSSELFVQEYAAAMGLEALVDRCGVLAGPWQMGKVDQGFLALWAARHLFGGPLSYQGFGGRGLQVRDLLHVEDLHALIAKQVADFPAHAGRTYNVGGGAANAVSLRDVTALCESATGNRIAIGSAPETHPADVPWYVTDNADVARATGWTPARDASRIVEDTVAWLRDHRAALEPLLGR